MVEERLLNEGRRLSQKMAERVSQRHGGGLLMAMLAGSHCYGLSTPQSDVDVRCIHIAHTDRLLGLSGLNDSASTLQMSVEEGDDCDVVSQEVGKFCRLALQCNPNIVEMLFAPMDVVFFARPEYVSLRDLRFSFLSTKTAQDAYLGYSRSQLERLLRKQGNQQLQSSLKSLNMRDATARMAREAEKYGLETVDYDLKHGMHLVRLLIDLRHLLTEGAVKVDMTDYRDQLMPIRFGEVTLAQLVETVSERMVEIDDLITAGASVLPDEAEKEQIEEFLVKVRKEHLR